MKLQASLFLILLFVLCTSARAAGLPELKIPEAWRACEADSDCAIAGDGCRSCGKLIVVHKKHLAEFLDLDAKARAKENSHPACEACKLAVTLFCRQGICDHKRQHIEDRGKIGSGSRD